MHMIGHGYLCPSTLCNAVPEDIDLLKVLNSPAMFSEKRSNVIGHLHLIFCKELRTKKRPTPRSPVYGDKQR